jgi:heme oxygenase
MSERFDRGARPGAGQGWDPDAIRALRLALRDATAVEHEALEELPFFRTLATGAPDPRGWAGYLETLEMVYQALEEVRPDPVPPYPMAALHADRVRAETDGRVPARGGLPSLARIRAQLLAHRIRMAGAEDRVALAGTAWVLEGAALGATLLRDRLSSQGRASAWHDALAGRPRGSWSGYLVTLAEDPGSPTLQGRMEAAARLTFQELNRTGRALHPLMEHPEDDPHPGVLHELNPHAGNHPVPEDPRVLEAALRAGEESWSRWPYYRARYGDRGQAFTRSDSAWLATLTGAHRARGLEQVIWLADLLAQRGMPRILMEEHLSRLASALGAAHPATPILDEARTLLGHRRARWSPDRHAEGVRLRFDERAPRRWVRAFPRTGLLLASALADEADGLDRAASSLVEWFGDPARFPREWVAEVHRTVAAGRKRIRGLKKERGEGGGRTG